MSKILYTQMSPRHNWELLSTSADDTGNFIRAWNSHLKGVLYEKWLKKYPKARIGVALSDFDGGNLNEVDNLRPNYPMIEVWNVSDLVTKITIK